MMIRPANLLRHVVRGGDGARRAAAGQEGFMLLEVLLASFMLAVALLVIIEGLSQCIAAARSVQNYAVAEVLLANKSFEFRVERAQDWEDEGGEFPDYPGFEWRREFESTSAEGLWRQTITVRWWERNRPCMDQIVEYRYLPEKGQ